MYSPRFAHPHIPHQSQWRPHGPPFGTMWPMPHKNYPVSKGHNFSNNEDHWCETCDRGFRTSELLLNHKQQHQKCNIDGCQFIAHPKVITKHIQMQHSTGLYNKIAKLDNPEEIQKWRAERKKRYPTKENIDKKNAEIKEKIDRGEKMGMRNHREFKANRKEQGIKKKYSHDNNRKNFKRRFQPNKSFIEINNKSLVDSKKISPLQNSSIQAEKTISKSEFLQVDNSKTLKPFTGILNILDDDTHNDNAIDCTEICDSIEDDEYIIMDESDNKNSLLITEPVVCGALSSLICNYESSDEESLNTSTQLNYNKSEDLNTKNANDQNARPEPNECLKNNINNVNDEKSDDDSGPEETKIIKIINTENNTDMLINNKEPSNLESSEKAKGRNRQDKNKSNNIKPIPKKIKSKLPSTLLEKLLFKEIRQERNIVLQCIRYIVKNNYFEKSKD